jgi:hypothetical protein
MRGNLDAMYGPVGATLTRSAGVSLIVRGLRFDLALPLDRGREPQLVLNAGFRFELLGTTRSCRGASWY